MTFAKLQLFGSRTAGYLRRKRAEAIRVAAMRRAFSRSAPERLLLVTMGNAISQSQIYPFHHFAKDFHRLYGAEIREADLGDVLNGQPIPAKDATVVAFQTPFDISDADLQHIVRRLRAENPGSRLVHMDWSAPTDLRNAARLDPLVDLYVKKHLLRDRSLYGQPTRGDTNLTDHFSRCYGHDEPTRTFPLPDGFLSKLLIGPSFFVDHSLLPAFLAPTLRERERPIDIHARFETRGDSWYGQMRREAAEAVSNLPSRTVVAGSSVARPAFLQELTRAKIAFSPFGFGEVCWRDYEAVMAGSVLLKPDMAHIETAPDIFRPWETYAPIRWDFADLPEVVDRLLSDAALRRRIATAAFNVLHDYLCSSAFAESMQRFFPRG